MFQRLRGAIDRTIAEEQAKQRTLSEQANQPRSSSSTSRKHEPNAGPSSRATASDAVSDGGATADPSVFEAAFVIDDSDEQSRAGTPKPVSASLPTDSRRDKENPTSAASLESSLDLPNTKEGGANGSQGATTNESRLPKTPDSKDASPSNTMTPEIKQRLRKLEKLEATYPELLRSYRVAHRRATAIEPFEKALRENTPLTSIGDPSSLIEYLNQLNLRGDMAMDELKRVSAERDELQKRHDDACEKLQNVRATDTTPSDKDQGRTQDDQLSSSSIDGSGPPSVTASLPQVEQAPALSKELPQTHADSTGLFSYDEEISKLHSKLSSGQDEVDKLRLELVDCNRQLAAAQEHGAGLTDQLQKSMSEAVEASASRKLLETQLTTSQAEISTLRERLQTTQSQIEMAVAKAEEGREADVASLQKLGKSLKIAEDRAEALDTKASAAEAASKKLADELSLQIETLHSKRSEDQAKIDDLSIKLASTTAPKSTHTETATPQSSISTAPASSTKKGKKGKKKKGNAATSLVQNRANIISDTLAESNNLEIELSTLRNDAAEKDAQIQRLTQQRKAEEDLREEIESLQEDLVNIGQDHVEAKEKIKLLESAKTALQDQVTALEGRLHASVSASDAADEARRDMKTLQEDYNHLAEKSALLQTDLGAAQQLAQTRFKDLSELKDVLQKVQPELKALRQDATTLRITKDELSAKQKELREAEKREKDLRRELDRARDLSNERMSEIQDLQGKIVVETSAKAQLENDKRITARDLRKAEADKAEWKGRAENAERELERVTSQVNKLRPNVKDLEEQVHKLNREKSAAQEEVDFKMQQFSNAQSLLSSMRDQATEATVQLKESQSQVEALEEELAEVQRLLQERSREGETMRRLLSDVDERADGKVRDLRARMEQAIEERDRAEEDSSTLARRKNRETEELKGKIRALEQEVKSLIRERDELEAQEKEWRRRRDELEAIEQKAESETSEMRSTVSHLRIALDASETQVRDAEKQRAELRRLLDEAKQKFERASRELKSSQARLSSRSSIDSNRSGVTNSGGSAGGAGELMYLKTILLQFLEQKDGKLRAQLVPVLGKLLRFDKTDEAKWLSAVQHLEVR